MSCTRPNWLKKSYAFFFFFFFRQKDIDENATWENPWVISNQQQWSLLQNKQKQCTESTEAKLGIRQLPFLLSSYEPKMCLSVTRQHHTLEWLQPIRGLDATLVHQNTQFTHVINCWDSHSLVHEQQCLWKQYRAEVLSDRQKTQYTWWLESGGKTNRAQQSIGSAC